MGVDVNKARVTNPVLLIVNDMRGAPGVLEIKTLIFRLAGGCTPTIFGS